MRQPLSLVLVRAAFAVLLGGLSCFLLGSAAAGAATSSYGNLSYSYDLELDDAPAAVVPQVSSSHEVSKASGIKGGRGGLGRLVDFSSFFVAPRIPVGALDDASTAAFRAAENVADFRVPLKHKPGAGGNYARFGDGVDQHAAIRDALTSDAATFRVNYVNDVASDTSFRVVTDVGRVVGSNGETSLRVVVGNDGQIWTAFPVK